MLHFPSHRPRAAKPRPRLAVRRTFDFETTLPGSPERIFPLLCPVREEEWIEGWRAEAVHSASGFAEIGAMFRTRIELGELWVTSRHEPPTRVEYTIVARGGAVLTLAAGLSAGAEGTTRWRIERTYTGIGWLGRHRVRALTEAGVRAENERLARQLEHFLRSGRMLLAREAPAGRTGVSGPSTAGTRA
jgi:hypothetical protein